MNPDRCHCEMCRVKPNGLTRPEELASEIVQLRKAVAAAIEVAYDPSKQPALVLTLLDLGFINIRQRGEFPQLED